MSAIAGTLEYSRLANPGDTSIILAALRPFGTGAPHLLEAGPACLGVDRYPTLPEDTPGERPIEAGRFVVVADVRLDNRGDLLGQLHVDPACTDQHLIASAWAAWGDLCLPRLLGDFALAAFDRESGVLHLARDACGERPLFVRTRPDGFAFASMPLGLIGLDEPPRIDGDAVAAGLCDRSPPGRGTYFEGIDRVLPGEHWRISRGGLTRADFWKPSFEPLRLRTDNDFVDAFREQLDRAVNVRLRRRGGNVGSLLSAGYDSSAVTSTAARLAGRDKVIAFTHAPMVGFHNELPRGTIGDESDVAKATAAYLGIEHHVVRGQGDPLLHLRPQALTYQEPHRNVLNSGWEVDIDTMARSRGCGVMLTGEFGNLTLHAGGTYILGEYLRGGRIPDWLREVRATQGNPFVSRRSIAYHSFAPWMPPAVDRWLRRRYLSVDTVDVGFLKPAWTTRAAGVVRDAAARKFEGHARLRWSTLRDADPAMVRKGILAESGIDTRDPLMDRDLVEFGLRLPIETLYRDGRAWPLARRALADRLPPEITDERLRGYQSVDWRSRLDPVAIAGMIDDIEQSETARALIDFAELRRAAAVLPDRHLARADTVARYTGRLPGAIAMGYFLLAAERAGARPAA